MTDTLTLHHLEYSQSFRVLWMLEELQAPYDLVVYDRDALTMSINFHIGQAQRLARLRIRPKPVELGVDPLPRRW